MEQGVYKRKRPKRGKRMLRFIAGAAVLLLIISALAERSLSGSVRAAAAACVSERASRVLASAAAETLLNREPEELLAVTKTGEESFLIIADTARINALAGEMTHLAQELLAGSGAEGVMLPLGTLTGLALFSGRGPELDIRFTPIGGAEGSLSSSLRAAGINQSLFSIDLTLYARIRVLLAGRDEEITVKTTVPICETVVVGNVPQVYTNVANEEDMLNLIPTDVP
jgi:sporulation protein YunB